MPPLTPLEFPHKTIILDGLAVSPGIAIGPAYILSGHGAQLAVTQRFDLGTTHPPEQELARFAAAIATATKQLNKLKRKTHSLPKQVGDEMRDLLDARLHMLDGSRLIRGVEHRISKEGLSAEAALNAEIDSLISAFERMNDAYLAARVADIRELGDRLLRILVGAPYEQFKNIPGGAVVLAEELTPADTMLLDPAKVLGLACVLGGVDSHTGILTRSLGIPAVLGVADLLNTGFAEPLDGLGLHQGALVIIDGSKGRVIINPAPEILADYRKDFADLKARQQKLFDHRALPAETLDGKKIAMAVNLERIRDVKSAIDAGAEAIGLLRTEFLFMNRDDLPNEDEQFQQLAEIVTAMAGRSVTIRTLDIGGDKLPESLRLAVGEPEIILGSNPALGMRGVRFSLAHQPLFVTQLRAILRVAALGPASGSVRIMLPMVSSTAEVVTVREIYQQIWDELQKSKHPLPAEKPQLGVMIEVPAAALAADQLAQISDFFSIGTNDLTMYSLAIDRGDERMAALYTPIHSAVLRLIQFTVEAGRKFSRPVSVCGEMAGDVNFTQILLGLGVRSLSMSPPSLMTIKQKIRSVHSQDCAILAAELMSDPTMPGMQEGLQKFLTQHKNHR
ncbi:MAG: phosphoenolpyruvate--protein phosphotransferase [Alphaproteobacteria bacterium]|nr:phosphoenolpyruvate--protein phosphotransferase [Alphaproteobacteria bacterium]